MPLVLIVGRPSSGKTTVACQIRASIERASPGLKVDVIDDAPNATQTKSDLYRDSKQEKMTLGSLRSGVERRIHKSNVLIVDSLNMIKGYRYELWALARQAGTRCCVVSIETGAETCKAWNAARDPEERYEDAVMDDLVGRMERPDSKWRWESPLFSLYPDREQETADDVARVCEEVAAYCVGDANDTKNNDTKNNDIKNRNERSEGRHQTARAAGPGDLNKSIATARATLAPTNLLHDIDKEVQATIRQITDAQTLAGGAPAGIISFGPDMPVLNATRPITTVELRRWKRMFVKMVTNNTFNESQPKQVSALFVQYVSQQLHGCG